MTSVTSNSQKGVKLCRSYKEKLQSSPAAAAVSDWPRPALAEEGAFVFITGRRQVELDKAVALIGKNAIGIQARCCRLKDIDALYTRIAAEKGKIDILIANAVVEHRTIDDATPDVSTRPWISICVGCSSRSKRRCR